MWDTIYVKLSILIEVTGTVVLALSECKSTCMVEFSAGKAARVAHRTYKQITTSFLSIFPIK